MHPCAVCKRSSAELCTTVREKKGGKSLKISRPNGSDPSQFLRYQELWYFDFTSFSAASQSEISFPGVLDA